MKKTIGTAKVLFINCPKEMIVERHLTSFGNNFLSVVRIDPDTNHCCLDYTSTENFVMNINNKIMSGSVGELTIYLVHFRNNKAIENTQKLINDWYPDNLVEFMDNPYFQDIYELIHSYLYILKESPNNYGYKADSVDQMIDAWNAFRIIDNP